jgi:drug/metabolite transporter (DMT)-like permease
LTTSSSKPEDTRFVVAGLLMVTLAAASWGTWSLFLRPTGLPPSVTSPLLFLVEAIVAMPFALAQPRVAWNRRKVGLILANTAFDVLNILTFFAAIQVTTVAIAVLSHYVAPILIALLAPRIDKIPSKGIVPAALVALAGLVIVLEPWAEAADGAALGALLGVLSATCYAGNMFVVRRLAIEVGATKAMAYHALIAAILLAPLLFLYDGAYTAPDVGLLAAGAVTIGALSGVVFANGVARIGSARAAVLTFAEPLVAVAVGVLVWEEPLRPLAIVGGALVLGAGIHVARKTR